MNKKKKIKNLYQGNKWILLVNLAIVFISCTTTNENGLSDWDLKGNVKSCFSYSYEVESKFGKWEKGKRRKYGHTQVTFDKKGGPQEEESYNSDMDLISKIIYVCENGQILEYAAYSGDGKLLSKTKYNYISNSEILTKRFYFYNNNNDSVFVDSVNITREKGKMRKQVRLEIRSDTAYDIRTICEFNYNEEGNKNDYKVIKELYKEDDIFHTNVFKYRYEYLEFDTKNNWTKRILFGEYDGKSEPICMEIREIKYY